MCSLGYVIGATYLLFFWKVGFCNDKCLKLLLQKVNYIFLKKSLTENLNHKFMEE